MGFRQPFRTAFGVGAGTSTLVPEVWDVAVQGRTLMFDSKYFGTQQFRRSSIDLLSPRAVAGSVNEESLNPADGLVARVKSWHHGAGQTFLDREESDPYRFRSSKGVDVWTKGKLSLLPATRRVLEASILGSGALLPAGSRLYATGDGTTPLRYTSDILTASPSWTTVTGAPATDPGWATTDGYRVWVPFYGDGIYETNAGTGALASRTTGTVQIVGWVKGRLMVANNNSIYNVTDLDGPAVALPSALFTHSNTAFQFIGFAEGQNNIYAAGTDGARSTIYRTAVKADGTALDAPVVAGTLPDGEVITSISSYLTLILIGTETGWWVAGQDSNGDLSLNKVQNTPGAVRCFEGQGDFIWYGWSDFDDDSTGLGRADLRSDTKGAEVITPAYASDLMVDAEDGQLRDVVAVTTFQNVRVFSIGSDALGDDDFFGVWVEHTDEVTSGSFSPLSGGSAETSQSPATKVSSGYLNTGQVSFGFTDEKTTVNAIVNHEALEGTIAVAVTTVEGATVTAGTATTQGSTSQLLSTGTLRSEAFDVTLTLTRSSTDDTAGPVLTRVTLESNLTPGRGEWFQDAYLLYDTVELVNGNEATQDTADLYRTLLSWYGTPVTRQDALGSETVTLEAHDFILEDRNKKRDGYQGTFLAKWRRGRRR